MLATAGNGGKAVLEVVLLGAPRVRRTSGAPLPLAPAATSLLAFLALNDGHARSREALTAAFCADVPEDAARRRLNTTVWRLRKVLGDGYVTTTGNGVGIDGEDVWVDAVEFEHRVAPALQTPPERMDDGDVKALADAVTLYTGDLMEGTYDEWVLRERDRLSDVHLTALARLVLWYERRDAEATLHYARLILDRDPLREDVHRAAMRAYADLGRRQEAIAQYDACAALLRDELDLTPLPETTALAAAIAQRADHTRRDTAKDDVVRRLRDAQRTLATLQAEVQRAIDDLVSGP